MPGPAPKDLTDQRFGRLVVIERAGPDKNGRATWLCRCDCAALTIKLGMRLYSGRVRSCGCLARDVASARTSERNCQPRKPTQRDIARGRARSDPCAGASGKFHADERAAIEAFEAAGKVTVIVGPFPDLDRPELWPRGTIRSRQRGNINSRMA